MTSPAERKAAQRARARSSGLCACCCYRKARKGRATCQPCLDAARERRTTTKAKAAPADTETAR